MKKMVSCLLVLAMMMSFLSIGGFSVSAIYRDGDLNGDSEISTADVRMLLTIIVSSETVTDNVKDAADVNNDGVINTADAKRILDRMSGEDLTAKTVDLLAPSADSWYNPVVKVGGTASIVSEADATDGGYVFTNNGGVWPYTAYIYDDKLLLPTDAVIEYDLTVNCSSASINLYTGGSAPNVFTNATTNENENANLLKLNSYISSDSIDEGSGDLLAGTYQGSIPVAMLKAAQASLVDGMIWVSAVQIYAVGTDQSSLTIRKLQVKAYQDPGNATIASDPLEAVRYGLINNDEIEGLSMLTSMELYENGQRTASRSMNTSSDHKKIYHTQTVQRVYNYADGYQIDIPFDWEEDYSMAALRCRYTSSDYSLTITKETQNPYGNTRESWETYLTEWLDLYINDPYYLTSNNMTYARAVAESTTILPGYSVLNYDIVINSTGLAMPYYSIAVIRETSVYDEFYLMVLKSAGPTTTVIDRILRSFKQISSFGTAVNTQGQYEQIIPEYWNEETKAYFNQLMAQDETDFGFFAYSMVSSNDGSYDYQHERITTDYERLSTVLDYEYEIMPTYTHLKYYDSFNDFPAEMAVEFAGGNGFNGKPVLQMTYQFTTRNNSGLNGYTPMFDILRGVYDDQLRKFAQDVKAYGKPVLFRLNNEMNTDWTSYAGIVTLLDPDVFVQTWQRMYDIFVEEGVDNCIWIFNPFGMTTPYCSWGDAMCYMPGAEYVQALGLTGYEMGNGTSVPSFKTMYTEIYNDYNGFFSDYPWIISEFACGSGGEKLYNWSTEVWEDSELGRNQALQAAWVEGMFECLNNKNASGNEFCKNIKGAVWFSANDYCLVDDTYYIANYLALDSDLTQTLAAFKEGLEYTK